MKKRLIRLAAVFIMLTPLAACHQTEMGKAVGFPAPDKPQQGQR